MAQISFPPGNVGQPTTVRVLLANEPRVYRETLVEAIQQLRPETEVLETEPDSIESRLSISRPHMVICDRATDSVSLIPVWVELYPGYGPRSVVSVEGTRWEVEEIQLSDLLDLVDKANGLAQQG